MNLKAIREARGFSDQESLADAIGTTQPTVHRMETLSPAVTLRMYMKAAAVLNVSLAEIFADARSQAETVLVQHWRSLSRDEQDRWSEHLRLAAGHSPEAASESSETDLQKEMTKG